MLALQAARAIKPALRAPARGGGAGEERLLERPNPMSISLCMHSRRRNLGQAHAWGRTQTGWERLARSGDHLAWGVASVRQ